MKKESAFEKSSLRNWTNEIFKINKVFITDPVTYELVDLKSEKFQAYFIVKNYKKYEFGNSQ